MQKFNMNMSAILTSHLNHSQTNPSIQKSLHKRELNISNNIQNPFNNIGNIEYVGTKHTSRYIRSLKMTISSNRMDQNEFVSNNTDTNTNTNIYINRNIEKRNVNRIVNRSITSVSGIESGRSRNVNTFNTFNMYDLSKFKKGCNCG